MNAVLLPHVIMFNAEVSPERFVPLAKASGIRTKGVPAAEVALLLAEAVRELADEAGVPKGLAESASPRPSAPDGPAYLKDACIATNPRQAERGTSRRCSGRHCDAAVYDGIRTR